MDCSGTDVRRIDEAQEVQCKLLHDLNNVLVAILLNTQIIEWKLPSYSKIMRNLHEVERRAQHGALLVSRLRGTLKIESAERQEGEESAEISAT
jgi:hypothetical protein